MSKGRHHTVSNYVSIALAASFAWVAFDIVFDNIAPLTVSEHAEVLNNQPVARYDTLKIRYNITVNRYCSGVGQRVFTDAGGIQYPAISFTIDTKFRRGDQLAEAGETFDSDVDVTVPLAAPGLATYQNQTVFYCNFWQRLLHRGIAFSYPMVRFEIGSKVLPQVRPSTSIFKRTDNSGVAAWIREHVWLVEKDD